MAEKLDPQEGLADMGSWRLSPSQSEAARRRGLGARNKAETERFWSA